MRLTRAQLEQLVTITGQNHNGQELYGACPYCQHAEWHISLVRENHPFTCYRKRACGRSGNIYTLLALLGRAKEFLKDRPVNHQLSSFEVPVVDELDLTLPEVQLPFGWERVWQDPYLDERGFTSDQYQKFKVGRSRFKRDYVTFLVEMRGVVTGYVSRSIQSKQWIDEYNRSGQGRKHLRYDNSPTDFSKMLFGYDELVADTTDVILVEGIFSKTRTDSNLGLDDSAWLKCCATFGAKVSSYQVQLLLAKGVRNVWLWHEADVLKKVKRTASELAKYFNVRVSYLPDFDPADINCEQAVELMDKSVNFIESSLNFI